MKNQLESTSSRAAYPRFLQELSCSACRLCKADCTACDGAQACSMWQGFVVLGSNKELAWKAS